MPRKIPKNVKGRVKKLIADGVVERETIKKVKQPNPARKIEFEVGDAMQDDFYPQFKTKHWDNEVNFSARLVTKDGAVTEHDGKLAYDDGEQIARFYEKDTGDEDGGFEFDVVLPRKPKGNKLTWTLQHKGLDFFYQPELTPEEKEQGAHRPENVVGSYAVYHKTGRNNKVGGKEYRTGKAFHIYRPYFEDANGDWVWGELSIDTDKNDMTVTAPEGWLDTAAYPVVLDPTFGYTSIGSTSGGSNKFADLYGNLLSNPGTSIDISKLTVYLTDVSPSSETVKVQVGEKSSLGSGAFSQGPTEVPRSIDFSSEGDSWQDFTYSPAFNATDSYVALTFDPGYFDGMNGRYDSTGTEEYGNISSNDDEWHDMGNGRSYSIYATYTATGGSSRRIIIT